MALGAKGQSRLSQNLSQSISQGISQGVSQGLSQRLAMTPGLKQSLQLMAMKLGDIRRHALDLADENPFLDVTLPSLPTSSIGTDMAFDFDRISHDRQHPITLAAFVINQIGTGFADPDDRAIALAMVEYLLPVGWLDENAWQAMQARGITQEKFDQILHRLQGFEPVGVFARDLSECLSLQLADRGLLDEKMTRILAHLHDLQDGVQKGVDVLAEKLQMPLEDITSAMMLMRQCQPKPGADFIQDDGDIFHPDLTINLADDGFDVTVNQGMMPSISVKQDVNLDDDASKILFQKAQEDARILTHALARRHDMLLDCGRRLVQHQADFLRHGEAHIKPLTMAGLADEMGVHKSTISRAIADKLVDAPKGMMPLSDLFSASVRQPDGGLVASRQIIAMIRAYLANEDHAAPMSDQDLTDHFAHQGLMIARRTIAKYRHKAGFKAQAKRRNLDQGKPL